MKSDKLVEIADRVQELHTMTCDLMKELKPYMSNPVEEEGDMDEVSEGSDLYKPGIDDGPIEEDAESEEGSSDEDEPIINEPPPSPRKGDKVALMIALMKKKRSK